ncbi:MAG: response regulator [Aestuariivirga sp.]
MKRQPERTMARKLDILIVDDDVDNALSLGELLELEGHRPHVVHSGEAAIEAFVQGNFDVSFIDVLLPGLNGVESFLKIKKLRPDAKVYMMSGFSVAELLNQAMCNGAMGVLSKPMEPQKIMELVREVGENGIVVAPRFSPGFSKALGGALQAAGMPCQIVDKSGAINPNELQGVPVILDLNASLIETVEAYAALRRAGSMPATVIVAGSDPVQIAGDSILQNLKVTGVLNKPFDPEALLELLNREGEALN